MYTANRSRPTRILAALALGLALPPLAIAQEQSASTYPNRTIHVIVGFTPSSAPDLTARIIAQKLSETWHQPIIVENKTGAGSAIAAHYVADSPADGYTLLSVTSAHAVLPAINAPLQYDTLKDFAPIAMTSLAPLWLVVSPSLNVKSLRDFVALAKEKPNQLNYGSAGVGSLTHFAAAMFNDAAGIQAQHVPYKGIPEVLDDLIAGRVQYFLSPLGPSFGFVHSGKLIALAVTGNERLAEFPNVPTVAQAGFPGYRVLTWTGLLAPAGTPTPIINKLNQAIVGVLDETELKKKWAQLGLQAVHTTPAEYQKTIAEDVAKFTAAARKANISVK
jgi:tripartite-type tricarboxylate transporter receptor subunit TctC